MTPGRWQIVSCYDVISHAQMMHAVCRAVPGVVLTMKRYKFQALITLDPPPDGGPATMPPGQMRRLVVRGQRHQAHGRMFSALVTNNGEDAQWLGDGHVIVTIVLVGDDDPGECLGIGDHVSLWLRGDVGHGVITRRLFV
jgi:hypothetical protein